MTQASRAYARTQVETASKERTLVLLFERAQSDLRASIVALGDQQQVEAVRLLAHASDILCELKRALNDAVAPQLCEQLREVYGFALHRVSAAMATGEVARVEEALRVLQPVADGFAEAVQKLAPTPQVAP